MEAVQERNGLKLPGKSGNIDEDDGTNKDTDYYSRVFYQLLNLWQTNDKVKELIPNEDIGKMAVDLSGAEGIRIWHDQALIKCPG